MSNSITSSTATPQPGTVADRLAGGRQVLSAIDDEIIRLLTQRRAVSHEIASVKAEVGVPYTDLQQERRVIDRYTQQLGAYGASLAHDILRISKA